MMDTLGANDEPPRVEIEHVAHVAALVCIRRVILRGISQVGIALPMQKSTIERAFELARSGHCVRTSDIRLKLRAEGYDTLQIQGRGLLAQLRDLMKNARPESAPVVDTRE
jgi:hypothetical protein